MFNLIKGLLNIVIVLLLSVLVCIMVLLVVGYKPYIVKSESMAPTFHKGTLVFVKETDFNKIKEDDIITFYSDSGNVVTHRAVNVDTTNNKIITKGDSNSFADVFPVTPKKLIGKIAFSVPKSEIIFSKFVKN